MSQTRVVVAVGEHKFCEVIALLQEDDDYFEYISDWLRTRQAQGWQGNLFKVYEFNENSKAPSSFGALLYPVRVNTDRNGDRYYGID